MFSILKRKLATAAAWKPWFANSYEWLKACGVFLTGRSGGAISRLIVPVRLAGQSQPVYLRCASSDFSTLHEVFVRGEYDVVLPYTGPVVRGILDLGANVGCSARWFLQRWPAAHVIAVEPDQGNVAVLARNLRIAKSQNARHRIVNAFVGGRTRQAVLRTRGEGFANEGTLVDESPADGQNALPVFTPRQLLEMSEAPVDLVKMDIEGSEKEVLEGDLSWLTSCSVLVLEVHAPLDESWLADIVNRRLPMWALRVFETRRGGGHLAVLSREEVVEKDGDRFC